MSECRMCDDLCDSANDLEEQVAALQAKLREAEGALEALLNDPGPEYLLSKNWDRARAALSAIRESE